MSNARVYQRLRTAHLERAHSQTPASILYVERSYDFADDLADGLDLIEAGTFGAPAVMLASRLRTVEINEPLVRQRLVRTVATVVAARLAGRLHRLPVSIVTHAIENRDPFSGPAPSSLTARVRFRLDDWLSRRVARRIDRISFGTEAAQELYLSLRGRELRSATQALFPELPAACDRETSTIAPSGVVFLGAFDERKGVRQLLAAWPFVSNRLAGSRLTLLGKGPLLDEVETTVANLAGVTVVVDPPRDDIHEYLRSAQVLALLSRPRPRWREQVGLPIVEALAHGCTIVTTEQTGLASWLSAHGHYVVESDSSDEAVAEAIADALIAARPASDVTKDLPPIDGRSAADSWLFAADPVALNPNHAIPEESTP
jgi:glycosyltransferase involved in cell wall biosynthesis